MAEELVDICAPEFAESIADGTVAQWHAAVGEAVQRDALLVEIETDKVVIEVFAEHAGTLTAIAAPEGATVLAREVLGQLAPGVVSGEPVAAAAASAEAPQGGQAAAGPAARRAAAEADVPLDAVSGSGRGGRVTREDVASHVADGSSAAAAPAQPSAAAQPSATSLSALPGTTEAGSGERPMRRVPMTRLRASVARRLVEAQQTAAMLTTFNEVDMGPVRQLRSKYRDLFSERHEGSRLGFMSFFVRAAVEALKRFPAVNGSIDGNDILYHGYYDVGVAVSTPRGLVVPVVRDADGLSLAQIENQIRDFGLRARDGKLTLDDMTGGTFSISNGGVFGSLMSTPILNPPQTAILGMHKVQDRAMVEDGQVVIRPMMYLALSYDHRLIDGSDAVQFLVAIKDMIEDPARILLEL